MLTKQSKQSKHSRATRQKQEFTDLQVRRFPRQLRITCKLAALEAGVSLREWFIAACRKSAEERKG